MQCQSKRFRPGHLVKVHPCHGGYALPDGLPNGATVKVLASDHGSIDVHFDGNKFTVSLACIDSGYLYELRPGVWLDEADPRIQAAINKEREFRKYSMPPTQKES